MKNETQKQQVDPPAGRRGASKRVASYLAMERRADVSSPGASAQAEASLRTLLRSLPVYEPSQEMAARILDAAAEQGALLPWNERRVEWPTFATSGVLAQRFQKLARWATVVALLVVGCGISVIATLFGSVVASFGIAGSAVWSSRWLLSLWTWTSETLRILLAAADVARSTLLATSGGSVVALTTVCVLLSALGLIGVMQLRRSGDEHLESRPIA